MPDGWEVYHGSRGNKIDRIKCQTIMDASTSFLKMIGAKSEINELLLEFYIELSGWEIV